MRSRIVVAFALAACTTGEDVESTMQPVGACTQLEGYSFASVTEMECGLTPDGVALCPWHISFEPRDGTQSDFSWQYSDVVESGIVRCDGDRLATIQAAYPHEGTYDPLQHVLVWEGTTYTRQ